MNLGVKLRTFDDRKAPIDGVSKKARAKDDQDKVGDAGVDVELLDAVISGKLPAGALVGGVFFSFGRRNVIENDRDAARIVESIRTELAHDVHRAPRCRMAHHEIGKRIDDDARLDTIHAGGAGEYFLRYGPQRPTRLEVAELGARSLAQAAVRREQVVTFGENGQVEKVNWPAVGTERLSRNAG